MNTEDKTIYLLLGASGSGKTKLGKELREKGIPELVSDTTRMIRLVDGEIPDVTYHYLTVEEFKKKLAEGKYAEYTEYPKNSNRFYGLSKKEVQDKLSAYDEVFAIVEIKGMEQIKETYGDMVKVIYIQSNLEIMKDRMIKRGDKPEDIEARLNYAITSNELDNWKYADYTVDNTGDFETTKKKLFEIVGLI